MKEYTYKNLSLPEVHLHSSHTQICQRLNRFHINHIAATNKMITKLIRTHTCNVLMSKVINSINFGEARQKITFGLRCSWTWKVATGPESMLMSHN